MHARHGQARRDEVVGDDPGARLRAALPRDHLADLLQQQLGGAVVALPGGLADHLPQGCRVDGGQRGRLRRGRPGACAAADHHAPFGQQVHEQLGRRGRGVGGGIGPVIVVRVDDVAVVDGEGRQRPRLAVAAVAGRPRRHVAHRVVAAVVAHQRALDLAQAGGGHAVGERLQRGARLGRAREAGHPVRGGQQGVAAADHPEVAVEHPVGDRGHRPHLGPQPGVGAQQLERHDAREHLLVGRRHQGLVGPQRDEGVGAHVNAQARALGETPGDDARFGGELVVELRHGHHRGDAPHREHRGGGPGCGWDHGGGAGQQRGEHQPAQRASDLSQHPHAAQRDGGRGSRAARKKPRTCARRASSALAPMGSRSMRPSRNGTSLK